MKFTTALFSEVVSNLSNCYEDNFDYYRFQKPVESSGLIRLKKSIKKYLMRRGFFRIDFNSISSKILAYDTHIANFEYLYNLLDNQSSKELVVKLMAYRILGFTKVKLPTNNEYFWSQIAHLEELGDRKDTIDIGFNNWKLCRYQLEHIGIPIEIYYSALGIYVEFILKQYEYRTHNIQIGVREGDIVIDAGGCYGDTALYFANATGERGKVHTFEFIPSNLEIMKRNIALNPTLERRIDIITQPLWSESHKTLFYNDNGPGSNISFESTSNSNNQVSTLALDDWAKENKIEKVDFIKMDIEGAELHALRGAEQIIRRHHPKLAISIYHRLEDFKEVPEYIESLNLGYKFYLGHYTIHAEETILFATA